MEVNVKEFLEKFDDLTKLKKSKLIDIIKETLKIYEDETSEEKSEDKSEDLLKQISEKDLEISKLSENVKESDSQVEAFKKTIKQLELSLDESELNNTSLKQLFKAYISGSIIVFIILFILIIVL